MAGEAMNEGISAADRQSGPKENDAPNFGAILALAPEEITARVRDAGVVGAGGAGFPTHVKLSARAETVIVNGAECEPLLNVDQYLLARHAREVFGGLVAALVATGAKEGIVALKGKHRELLAELTTAAASWQAELPGPVRIHSLPDVYPAGDEHVLVHEVTGKVVPPAGIPLAVGVVVMNVETAVNVARALIERKPVTHTWLTVAGEVDRPGVYRVPVGVSIGDVLAAAGAAERLGGGGGQGDSGWDVIVGGPMMGTLADDYGAPVTKLTKGLLVLPVGNRVIRAARQPLRQAVRQAAAVCCSCRACTDSCPRYLLGHPLEPHRLMAATAGRLEPDLGLVQNALLCSECGLCEQWACPMGLSPRRVNREFKRLLRERGIRWNASQAAMAVSAVSAGPASNGPPASVPAEWRERSGRAYRQVPSARLVMRLGLARWAKEMAQFSEDPKNLPEAAEITPRLTSGSIRIPLQQHAGQPAQAVVAVGQEVEVGSVVGEAPHGGLGARVHSGVSGRVAAVSPEFVTITIGR